MLATTLLQRVMGMLHVDRFDMDFLLTMYYLYSGFDFSHQVAEALESGVRVLLYVGDMVSHTFSFSLCKMLTLQSRIGSATGMATKHGH